MAGTPITAAETPAAGSSNVRAGPPAAAAATLRGFWRRHAAGASNIRTEPDPRKDNIKCVLRQGAVVEVAEHVGKDWVQLSGPDEVKDCYLRLRTSDAGPRVWKHIEAGGRGADGELQPFWPSLWTLLHSQHGIADDQLRLLIVGHASSPANRQHLLRKWLTSSARSVAVDMVHCSEIDWSHFVQSAPRLYDGIVLSGGSGVDSRTRLTEEAALREMDMPILGICFGMQLICRAYAHAGSSFLSKVSKSREYLGEQVEVPELNLHGTLMYHRMYGVRPQQVPESLVILQLDEAAKTVAVVRHLTKPVLGFQGHPEFDSTERAFSEQCLSVLLQMVDLRRRQLRTIMDVGA